MTKTITIGNEPYEIDYTPENAFTIFDRVLAWMQEKGHGASAHGEGIHQDDNCLIDAPTLISDIVDDVLKPRYLGEPEEDLF